MQRSLFSSHDSSSCQLSMMVKESEAWFAGMYTEVSDSRWDVRMASIARLSDVVPGKYKVRQQCVGLAGRAARPSLLN